jgi:hypothetical protein
VHFKAWHRGDPHASVELRRDALGRNELSIDGFTQVLVRDGGDLAALIALANAAMNDEDPRKFTREHVVALRSATEELARDYDAVATDARSARAGLLDDLADAIESFLPPER